MLSLSAKVREITGKKVKALQKKGVLAGVLYGPKVKNLNLELDVKEFEKIYTQAGESSLINLQIEGEKRENIVLIHAIQNNNARKRNQL